MRALPAAWSFAALLGLAAPAWGRDVVRFGPHDVPNVFAIGKSDDGNQVQYGLRLDAACKPVGPEPVQGYWHTYDEGPAAPLLDLNWLDRTAYGTEQQKVFPRGPGGPAVSMIIRTAPTRLIEFWVSVAPGGTCRAEARTPLLGRPAVLKLIYLQLGGFILPQWVELRGLAIDDGAELSERVKP